MVKQLIPRPLPAKARLHLALEENAKLRTRIAALEAQLADERAAHEETIADRSALADDVLSLCRRLQAAENKLDEATKALAALDRMNRGVDWCDQDEQARRWSAARRALEGGEA